MLDIFFNLCYILIIFIVKQIMDYKNMNKNTVILLSKAKQSKAKQSKAKP